MTGQRAATLTAASRFARFNASPVVLVRQHRDTARKHYTLEFTSLSPPLPSGDDDVSDSGAFTVVTDRPYKEQKADVVADFI